MDLMIACCVRGFSSTDFRLNFVPSEGVMEGVIRPPSTVSGVRSVRDLRHLLLELFYILNTSF